MFNPFHTILFLCIIILGIIYLYIFNPFHQLQYTGAISYFEVESGTQSFESHVKQLDLVSLFWYQLESDGNISRNDAISSDTEKSIIQFTHAQKKKVLLGVLNYGKVDEVESLFNDDNKRTQNINYIISVLKEKDYDGVVIDYENLNDTDAVAFTSYISQLSTKVHAQGKSISVSTIVQTTGKVFGGIDIVAVSKLVDRLELQVYGEHADGSSIAGPLAGIDWVDTIVKNTLQQGVSSNKIILGTVDSAHDWIVSPDNEFFNTTTTSDALIMLKQMNVPLQWDDSYKEYTASYTDSDNRKHVVWIEEARSFQAKQDLARKYGLQGVFIWFLGGEDSRLWRNIQ